MLFPFLGLLCTCYLSHPEILMEARKIFIFPLLFIGVSSFFCGMLYKLTPGA